MANNKTDVRRILDTVKADGRTSLTAPEGKLVCEAYGITVPKEGVATSAAEAAAIAYAHRLSGRAQDRLAGNPAQDRGRRRAGRREKRRRGRNRASPPSWRAPASTTRRRSCSAFRCSRCSAGGQEVIIGAVTDPVFGKLVAFGLGGVLVEVLKDITFRLAPALARRRAVDARRHRGRGDPQGRARRGSGRTARRSPPSSRTCRS